MKKRSWRKKTKDGWMDGKKGKLEEKKLKRRKDEKLLNEWMCDLICVTSNK